MRCIAVIEAQRPGLDSVIIWDRDDTLTAFAYLDGKVAMTRPLEHQDTLENAIAEAINAFQITDGQLTRITDWTNQAIKPQPVGTTRKRW